MTRRRRVGGRGGRGKGRGEEEVEEGSRRVGGGKGN